VLNERQLRDQSPSHFTSTHRPWTQAHAPCGVACRWRRGVRAGCPDRSSAGAAPPPSSTRAREPTGDHGGGWGVGVGWCERCGGCDCQQTCFKRASTITKQAAHLGPDKMPLFLVTLLHELGNLGLWDVHRLLRAKEKLSAQNGISHALNPELRGASRILQVQPHKKEEARKNLS
jgi:hypothetical protein